MKEVKENSKTTMKVCAIDRAKTLMQHFDQPLYRDTIRSLITSSKVYNFDNDPMLLGEIDPDPVSHRTAGWRMYKHTSIRVIDASSHTAIVVPKIENPDPTCRVAVLNFASAKQPGGKFLDGAMAQEEILCHNSLLYPIIASHTGHYAYNRAHLNNGIYPNTMIYSENVPFFDTEVTRQSDGTVKIQMKDLLRVVISNTCIPLGLSSEYGDNSMVKVDASDIIADSLTSEADVITCAAPNYKAYEIYSDCAFHDEDAAQKGWFNFFDAMRVRIHYIFRAALAHGVSDIILGAWGCGVFGCDPAFVASLFRYEIEKYWMCQFRSILFATPTTIDRHRNKSTINKNAFKVVFSVMEKDPSNPTVYWNILNHMDERVTRYFLEYMADLIKKDSCIGQGSKTSFACGETHGDPVGQ